MNYDVNDPLADILSDDNDSFFEEPKTLTKRGSITKTPEKKPINEIFNLNDNENEATKNKGNSEDWLGLMEVTAPSTRNKPASPVTKNPQKLNKRISFEDEDDILGEQLNTNKKISIIDNEENLGLSTKPSSAVNDTKAMKKISLLDDILAGPKEEKKSTVTMASTLDDVFKSSIANKEGRRSGRRTPMSSLPPDPLGLFSNEENPNPPVQKPIESKSAPDIATQQQQQGLPNWLLGGGKVVKNTKSEEILLQPSNKEETSRIQSENTKYPAAVTSDNKSTIESMLNQQKLAHLEYQNSAIVVQQQDFQVLMALQLRKYEESMNDMQRRQNDMLQKQEEILNNLVEKEMMKQQILENNMRLQQERINNHLQMFMLSQGGSRAIKEESEVKKMSEQQNSVIDSMNILKQRQHEEMFLLEESYKKQINLLEENVESVESRLRADIQKLSSVYEEKMAEIHKDHQDEITKYKIKISEINQQHDDEIKQMRENQSRILEEIKYEQSTLIENIKESKKSEMSIFSESNNYLQKLDSNIEILFTNGRLLEEMKDRVDKDYGILSRAREERMKAREEEINLMKQSLEKCRQSAEEERTQLMGLVRSLELKLAEQHQSSREERWAFQQATSTLAARTAALDREVEFNRQSIEREREQLKTLKEQMLSEQEHAIAKLTEEKLAISVEKSKLETSAKIQNNFDSQRAKSEIEVAIKVAKEAAEMTDKERENLHRQYIEVERLKRTLQDQERRLQSKEEELNEALEEASRKSAEAERMMNEYKNLEKQMNERSKWLQNQTSVLAGREKKITEEKISLSREKLAFHSKLKEVKQCGLCALDAPKLDEIPFPESFNVDLRLAQLRLRDEDMDNKLA